MEKINYIIEILEKIENEWLPARAYIKLLQQGELPEGIIEKIMQTIKTSLHEIISEESKESLEKSLIVLEKVKKLEKESKQHDEEDIKHLEELLQEL